MSNYNCKIPQDKLEEMDLHELLVELNFLMREAEQQYFQSGLRQDTHIRLRQVMQEFDNHLTFSAM